MASRLYVTYQLGGPSEVRAFSLDGRPQGNPAVAPISSVPQIAPLDDDALLFLNSSYVEPPAWYRYDPATGATAKTALFSTSPVDFSDAEVVREFAVSKDGTKVPVDIIKPKSLALDGTPAAFLYGYGGYGVSLSPGFSALRHIWIEQGMVYRRGRHPGRGRVRRGVAPGRRADPEAERLRRFRRGHGASRRPRLHQPAAARHHGRVERRPAHGGDDHPAPGPVPGLGFVGRRLRHAAERAHAQRRLQHPGIRHGQGQGPVRGALRLFALP